MTNLKKQEKLALKMDRAPLRAVSDRSDERRELQKPFNGVNKREELRRQADIHRKEQELNLLKQENDRLNGRNMDLLISRPEMVLYYASLFLSVNVIFGWMAYLALFI